MHELEPHQPRLCRDAQDSTTPPYRAYMARANEYSKRLKDAKRGRQVCVPDVRQSLATAAPVSHRRSTCVRAYASAFTTAKAGRAPSHFDAVALGTCGVASVGACWCRGLWERTRPCPRGQHHSLTWVLAMCRSRAGRGADGAERWVWRRCDTTRRRHLAGRVCLTHCAVMCAATLGEQRH